MLDFVNCGMTHYDSVCMLTEEVQELITKGETDRLEFTTAKRSTDKYAQAICAFSNDLGGKGLSGFLLYGIEDNGKVVGGEVNDKWLKDTAAIRDSGNILPQPIKQVNKININGVDIGVVKVEPHPNTPVRYKGTVWVRVGPRKTIASPAEERILIEKSQLANLTYDRTYVPTANLSDIDPHFFNTTYLTSAVSQAVLEENNRPLQQRLASLSLWNLQQEKPTVAGLLISGKDSQSFFPGAYIQLVKYDNSFEPNLNKRFTGNLYTQLQSVESFFSSQIITLLEGLDGFKDKKTDSMPLRAIRELVVNAVIHRDYQANSAIHIEVTSEMISIQSPGGLYGMANPGNFPKQNDYRNPVLAEAMVILGYANRFGNGIRAAKSDAEKSGFNIKFFYKEQNYFRVELSPESV